MEARILEMLDVTAPQHMVEVEIREDGHVVWVNVDGICRLRICQIGVPIKIIDNRPDMTNVVRMASGQVGEAD